MYIKYIALHNFKNYESASFDFSQSGCLIVGNNGIGKSNLLEAISYFAYGRSILGNNDNLLINYNNDCYSINSTFHINHTDTQFQAIYRKDQKVIKVDCQPQRRLSDLYKYLQVVYSAPDDIFNIFSTPTKRRQFLDMAISKVYIAYIDFMRRFRHSLTQRNALLSTTFSMQEKEAWDNTFAGDTKCVVEYRQRFFEAFKGFFQRAYQMIVLAGEEVDIVYKPNFTTDADFVAEMLSALRENIAKERKYQTSMLGPHRDDYIITINGKNAFYAASQGQKRSIVIAMKLALAKMIMTVTAVQPILIFDDTLAELDMDRTSALLSNLTERHQVFIASPTADRYNSINLPILKLEA